MYFVAELKDKKYAIEVFEHSQHWLVTLQEGESPKETHRISKADYRQMDDAVSFLFENSSYMVDVVGKGMEYTVYTRGSYRTIQLLNDEALLHESLKKGGVLGSGNELASGMPGKIVEIYVKIGDVVKPDQPLLIMEAMKMENEIRATTDARVKEILVQKGASVETGAILMTFEKLT
jgi:biotin carboxyl carrier protein